MLHPFLDPIQYTYTLVGHNWEVKKLHTYLSLGIENIISWSSHIRTISNRSTEVLNFIKRNLSNCSLDTKKIAYLTLVNPIMEHADPVWDPYYNTNIYNREK